MPEGAPSLAFKAARWVSIVAHPLIVPTLTALYAAWRRGAEPAQLVLLGGLLLLTATVMGVYTTSRVRSGHWQHMDASVRSERRDLNRFALGLLLVVTLVSWLLLRRPEFAVPLATAAAMLLVCMATGRYLKISHHVMFAVLPAGWLWPDPAALAVLAVLAGAVAWSRLRLGRHTPAEVVAGALLGAAGAATVIVAL